MIPVAVLGLVLGLAPAPAVAPAEPEPDSVIEGEAASEPGPVIEPEPVIEPNTALEPGPADVADSPPAIGGSVDPLPPPPPREDPRRISPHPWRGRGWFEINLGAAVPVGGHAGARGDVVAVAGGFAGGYRVHSLVGLYTGLTTFSHDARQEVALDEIGREIHVTGFGRIVALDLATVRVFAPVRGRVEPYADVGAGVGIHRPPFGGSVRAVGLARAGLGVVFWVASTFTLRVAADYRLLAIQRSVGHTLVFGAGAAVHW